jgi:cyclopropane fatty-acyl-phospholipid synthase-like methyltransferase
VDFRVADATDLEGLPGPFDLVLDIGCFHSLSIEGMSKYIRNLERLLAPGSTFLLYGFFREGSDGGRGFTEADLEELGSHFSLVDRTDGSERGWRPSAWLTYKKTGDRS